MTEEFLDFKKETSKTVVLHEQRQGVIQGQSFVLLSQIRFKSGELKECLSCLLSVLNVFFISKSISNIDECINHIDKFLENNSLFKVDNSHLFKISEMELNYQEHIDHLASKETFKTIINKIKAYPRN